MEQITLRFDTSGLASSPLLRRVRGRRPHLQVPSLREEVRRLAARGWEDRARGEYVGVMIVRRFHGLLVDLNAPSDLQEVAIQMMVQEQRHLGLCMEAATALGHDGNVSFSLPQLQQVRGKGSLGEQLLDMVVGTYCVGEVVAHALLRHTLDVLPPSGFREVHRAIFKDEVLHARIGPALLGELRDGGWFDWPGEAVVGEMFRRHLAWMAGRDVIEPDEAALFEEAAAAEEMMAVGIPPSSGVLAAYRGALDGIAATKGPILHPAKGSLHEVAPLGSVPASGDVLEQLTEERKERL